MLCRTTTLQLLVAAAAAATVLALQSPFDAKSKMNPSTENHVGTLFYFDCPAHYDLAVCDQCKEDVPCSAEHSGLWVPTEGTDNLCWTSFARCLGERSGSRQAIPVWTLNEFKGSQNLCVNYPLIEDEDLGTFYRPTYGTLRGYTFTIETSKAFSFVSTNEAYLSMYLIGTPYGCVEDSSLLPAWLGVQHFQVPPYADKRLENSTFACFNGGAQFEQACMLDLRGNPSGKTVIRCPAEQLVQAIGEIGPGDKVQVVVQVEPKCSLGDGNQDNPNLPPMRHWELEVARSTIQLMGHTIQAPPPLVRRRLQEEESSTDSSSSATETLSLSGSMTESSSSSSLDTVTDTGTTTEDTTTLTTTTTTYTGTLPEPGEPTLCLFKADDADMGLAGILTDADLGGVIARHQFVWVTIASDCQLLGGTLVTSEELAAEYKNDCDGEGGLTQCGCLSAAYSSFTTANRHSTNPYC